MSELVIAIHEAVSPFNQVFNACCLSAAASIMIAMIKISKQGE